MIAQRFATTDVPVAAGRQSAYGATGSATDGPAKSADRTIADLPAVVWGRQPMPLNGHCRSAVMTELSGEKLHSAGSESYSITSSVRAKNRGRNLKADGIRGF